MIMSFLIIQNQVYLVAVKDLVFSMAQVVGVFC